MFDQLIHRWLRVPYALYTTVRATRRTRLTVLMIHGIGGSGAAWKEVIEKLPDDIRVVTVDLLGFGQSPKPEWAEYNARTQARSVLATYFKLRLRGQVLLVGHSLGALVAVEMARRYPLLVKGLVLCSPPFYYLDDAEKRGLPRPDKLLRSLYSVVKDYPDQFMKLSEFAVRYKLITTAFDVNPVTIGAYVATLEAAIINQTAMQDVQRLSCPIHIIHGIFDPMVVASNLSEIAKHRPNIQLKHVASGHDVAGPMIPATVRAIKVWLPAAS